MDYLRTIRLRLSELKLVVVLCLLCLVSFLVSACTRDSSEQFTISVEYRPIQLNADEYKDKTDYSSATVSIKRVDVNESNEESLSELITSPFRNGKVVVRRPIEQPVWMEVLVETDTALTPLKLRTFVEPGESVTIAVIDSIDQTIDDTIAHVGTLSNVQESSKKFSLSADLNASNFDFLDAMAILQTRFWNERGELEFSTISTVVVQDGRFNFDTEIEDPVILSVGIVGPNFYLGSDVIADAGATIRLEPSRLSALTSENLTTGWFQARENTSQGPPRFALVSSADQGRHKRLFESWEKSFTYRLMRKRLESVTEEVSMHRTEQALMRPNPEDTNDVQSEDNLSNITSTSEVKTDPAEGCEHVDLSQVLPDRTFLWMNSLDSLDALEDEVRDDIYNFRYTTLNDIARRARDPFDSLLALELGALYSPQDRSEAINILDRLSQNVVPVVAEERIAPLRSYHSAWMESQENEHRTIPGQKAPDFELLDLQGTSQTFSQILKESELIFLEFVLFPEYYASYIQNLSAFYNEYGEVGLQIVTVLFGVDSDLQLELVTNQNNAWIELLDPNVPLASEIAKSYATAHRSKDYLVDSHGCIVQRNPDMTDLRSYLNSYLDVPENPEP